LNEEWNCVYRSYTDILTATGMMKIVPHERLHNYKTYARVDYEVFIANYICLNALKMWNYLYGCLATLEVESLALQ